MSSGEPPNSDGSVSTERADAPPRAYAAVWADASRLASMMPLDGERRLSSAMTATSWRCKAAVKDGGRGVSSARVFRASRRSRSAVARVSAAAESRPRGPVGGVQEPFACTSALVRISYSSAVVRYSGLVGSTSGETQMPLTKRQREILNFLSTYAEERGYAPSFEEIASHF